MFVGAKTITSNAEVFFYQLVLQLIIETPKVQSRYTVYMGYKKKKKTRTKMMFVQTGTGEGLRTGPG